MNNRIKAVYSALLGLAAVFSPPALAVENNGVTAVPILRYDVGARPMAMAGAYGSVSDDIYAMTYNPAGLARIDSFQAGAMFQGGVMDTNLQYVAAAIPLPIIGLSGMSQPVLGFSFLSSNNGNISYNKLSATGTAEKSGVSTDAGGDHVLTMTYSENVLSHDLYDEVTIHHYLGGSLKALKSSLPNVGGDKKSDITMTGDVGYQGVMPELRTAVGLSVSNIGGRVQYLEEKSPLPMIVRGGASHYIVVNDVRLLFSMDALRYVNEKATRLRIGAESWFNRILFVRAGYKAMEDSGGFNFGVGGMVKDFSLDFGFALNNTVGNVYQFALTYRLDTPARSKQVLDLDSPRQKKYSVSERDSAPAPKAKAARPPKQVRQQVSDDAPAKQSRPEKAAQPSQTGTTKVKKQSDGASTSSQPQSVNDTNVQHDSAVLIY